MEYIKKTKKATVVFPIPKREYKIILGIKQEKIGAGLYNGWGGKVEPGQTIRENVSEEFKQETGGAICNPDKLYPVALVHFFFFDNDTDIPNFDVTFYIAEEIIGTIKDTREMKGAHEFPLDQIPYGQMLPADEEILSRIINNETFFGRVYFNKEMNGLRKPSQYEPRDPSLLEI